MSQEDAERQALMERFKARGLGESNKALMDALTAQQAVAEAAGRDEA